MYNKILFSFTYKGNPHVCNDMDESGKHYAKMKQARQREKYGTVPITYM